MNRTDWSSLWKKDDWWAVWVGGIILVLGVFRWLPSLPSIKQWTGVTQAFPAGLNTILPTLVLFILLLAVTLPGIKLSGRSLRQFIPGFTVVFGLAFLASWVGKYAVFSGWGLETVLWALILGLIISNIWRLPEWLKAGAQTEFFIKIGLVLLGAEILFSTIVKGGVIGMGQALLVVPVVWFFTYWVARRFGMAKTFSSTMASGVSICGVSAAIAAGGAVKGNPRQTSYVISLVLLVAMPMLVAMPLLAKALGMAPQVAGAWIGGTIDTTGAVVASGTLVDPNAGLQSAALVKMAQNVLIGFAAFLLAIWATFSPENNAGSERPRLIEIWYRLPKFIIGFVLASVAFSVVVEPVLGTQATSAVLGLTKGYREWFFTLAFVSIGLDTRFRELVVVGKGKPAAAFLVGQTFNIVWALLIVWLLWSGVLFKPPV
ncbi:MAG: putative sulfate exporter family transporter [Chloroflexota bacterium]